jgi:DNA-directed RNA polymerase specialized sigma24 family protein
MEQAMDHCTALFFDYVTHGDVTALDRLFVETWPSTVEHARLWGANEHDAELAAENAWVRVVESARRFDFTRPFTRRLKTIVGKEACRVIRARKTVTWLRGKDRETPKSDTSGGHPCQGSVSGLSLGQAIDALPAEHRAVIVECALNGFTFDLAGLLLGCSPETVATRMRDAQRALQGFTSRDAISPEKVVFPRVDYEREFKGPGHN